MRHSNATPGLRASHSISCTTCLDRLSSVSYSDGCRSQDVVMSDKVSERVLKSDAHPLVAFDAQQQSNANEARWKSEIFKKIIEVDNDVQDFLDQFVPTASKAFPPMPKGKRRRPIFCVPHDTPEPDMYPPLVSRQVAHSVMHTDCNYR